MYTLIVLEIAGCCKWPPRVVMQRMTRSCKNAARRRICRAQGGKARTCGNLIRFCCRRGISRRKEEAVLPARACSYGSWRRKRMAGNDAGGISTYSTAGADFGYATLWVIPVMCVLLLVVQMTAARMGAVTGKGFAALFASALAFALPRSPCARCLLATSLRRSANLPALHRAWAFRRATWVSVLFPP